MSEKHGFAFIDNKVVRFFQVFGQFVGVSAFEVFDGVAARTDQMIMLRRAAAAPARVLKARAAPAREFIFYDFALIDEFFQPSVYRRLPDGQPEGGDTQTQFLHREVARRIGLQDIRNTFSLTRIIICRGHSFFEFRFLEFKTPFVFFEFLISKPNSSSL
jgi:hypothetical protein